jgi:hypothetical protein
MDLTKMSVEELTDYAANYDPPNIYDRAIRWVKVAQELARRLEEAENNACEWELDFHSAVAQENHWKARAEAAEGHLRWAIGIIDAWAPLGWGTDPEGDPYHARYRDARQTAFGQEAPHD